MAGPAVPLCSSCWLYLPWSPALSRYPTDAPVDFKWKGASSLSHLSFVLWRHRMEARGSVKILFCRTAVFQKRRETPMRSCWPRQRSRATSIQSIVSDGWCVGMDVWIRCQLSLPGSLQNSSLVTCKAALWNGKSIKAAHHCDATSDSLLMSLPHWCCPWSTHSMSKCLQTGSILPSGFITAVMYAVLALSLEGLTLTIISKRLQLNDYSLLLIVWWCSAEIV